MRHSAIRPGRRTRVTGAKDDRDLVFAGSVRVFRRVYDISTAVVVTVVMITRF